LIDEAKPQPKPGLTCPLWRKDRSKVCHRCEWYIKVVGKDPQSMSFHDSWGCAIAWMPTLTIENSQRQAQTGAAVESFRNVMVKLNLVSLARQEEIAKRAGPNGGDNLQLPKVDEGHG
jgi:hypothetical protein